jgi:hypothetical protein
MIGDHCCTFLPQGEGNFTIVVEHPKELSGNWNPFGWVQSLIGVMGATIFNWLIYGLVLFFNNNSDYVLRNCTAKTWRLFLPCHF